MPDLKTRPLPELAGPARLARAAVRRRWQGAIQGLIALAALYVFIAAIHMMGHGLKTIAAVPASKSALDVAFAMAAQPLAGLCIGVLVTSLVQSSSFTTTLVVGLVAAGQIELATAIPIIMGANIGTSVTNLLVSLIHLRQRKEFQRSLSGAVVHDFFNVLTVLTLLPLEMNFKVISRPAGAFADWLGGAAFFTTSPKEFNVVRFAVKPIADSADWLLLDVLRLSPTPAGAIQAALAVGLLFGALFVLVKVLRGLLKDRLAGVFSRTLFRSGLTAFLVGLITTAIVQSSSVTTSLVVPLVGAGILTLRQIFPYTLGANIGTTVTAILAGLAAAAMAGGADSAAQAAGAAGLAVAFGHLLFNIYGTGIWWPLRWVPISLAIGFARMCARRRLLAIGYIVVIFYILPVAIVILVNR